MLKTKIKTTIQVFTYQMKNDYIDRFFHNFSSKVLSIQVHPFRFQESTKKQHLHQLHKNNATQSENTDNIMYRVHY